MFSILTGTTQIPQKHCAGFSLEAIFWEVSGRMLALQKGHTCSGVKTCFVSQEGTVALVATAPQKLLVYKQFMKALDGMNTG